MLKQGNFSFTLKDLKWIQLLGQGSFGEVWLVECPKFGLQFAAKVFKESTEDKLQKLNDEYNIQFRL